MLWHFTCLQRSPALSLSLPQCGGPCCRGRRGHAVPGCPPKPVPTPSRDRRPGTDLWVQVQVVPWVGTGAGVSPPLLRPRPSPQRACCSPSCLGGPGEGGWGEAGWGCPQLGSDTSQPGRDAADRGRAHHGFARPGQVSLVHTATRTVRRTLSLPDICGHRKGGPAASTALSPARVSGGSPGGSGGNGVRGPSPAQRQRQLLTQVLSSARRRGGERGRERRGGEEKEGTAAGGRRENAKS